MQHQRMKRNSDFPVTVGTVSSTWLEMWASVHAPHAGVSPMHQCCCLCLSEGDQTDEDRAAQMPRLGFIDIVEIIGIVG